MYKSNILFINEYLGDTGQDIQTNLEIKCSISDPVKLLCSKLFTLPIQTIYKQSRKYGFMNL